MWRVTVQTDPVPGATSYVWSVTGIADMEGPAPSVGFSVASDGDLIVTVVAKNATQTSPPSPPLTVSLRQPLAAPGMPRLVTAVFVP